MLLVIDRSSKKLCKFLSCFRIQPWRDWIVFVLLQKGWCAFIFGGLKKMMSVYYYDKAVTVAVQWRVKKFVRRLTNFGTVGTEKKQKVHSQRQNFNSPGQRFVLRKICSKDTLCSQWNKSAHKRQIQLARHEIFHMRKKVITSFHSHRKRKRLKLCCFCFVKCVHTS